MGARVRACVRPCMLACDRESAIVFARDREFVRDWRAELSK